MRLKRWDTLPLIVPNARPVNTGAEGQKVASRTRSKPLKPSGHSNISKPKTDLTLSENAELLFGALYDGESGFIEQRYLINGRSVGGVWRSFPDLKPVRAWGESEGANSYFGVALRESKRSGKAWNVQLTPLIWTDFDCKERFKGYETMSAAEQEECKWKLYEWIHDRCAALGLPPVAIVDSGNGFHVYWRLEQAQSHSRTTRYLRGLTKALGADINCAEVTRVLRIPDTLNHKSGAARPVLLLHLDPAARVSIEALEAVATGEPEGETGEAHWQDRPAITAPNPAKNPVLARFFEGLPAFTPCAEGKDKPRVNLPKAKAAAYPYIGHNREGYVFSLTIDLDRGDCLTRWLDVAAPMPSLIICRPEDGSERAGYGQYTYLLEVPVGLQGERGKRQEKWLRKIIGGLSEMLGADTSPSGYRGETKNPLYQGWSVREGRDKPYSLSELWTWAERYAADLTEGHSSPVKAARATVEGESTGRRNTRLREQLERWAARNVSKYREGPRLLDPAKVKHKEVAGHAKRLEKEGNRGYLSFSAAVSLEAWRLNTELLERDEVEAVARRCSAWAWVYANSSTHRPRLTSTGNVRRASLKPEEREPLTDDQREQNLREGRSAGGRIGGRAARAKVASSNADRIIKALGELRAEGIAHPSGRVLAERAGVSAATVKRFKARQAESGEGN